jgi:dipeptidase D
VSSIETLQPQAVWKIFAQICAIPHPSKHEIALRNKIQQLCEDKNLSTVIDNTGNLIVKKPATKGMENRKTVVMQGHIDMVPQKNADSKHNFVTDPIETYVDGDWLKAKGTTLGSDNGLGVAAALAILLSDEIPHGPLELLCTIEEETSMRGAFGLQPGYLDADIMLNLDTEDEGELYVGCAGGVDINASIKLTRERAPENHLAFELIVNGLLGGHSGLDIDQGRGNANQIINRFLMTYQSSLEIRVTSFNGGTLRNAIPRESFTLITVPATKVEPLKIALADFEDLMKKELGATETNLAISMKAKELPDKVLTIDLQEKVINAIAACISAPFRMSDQFEGIVETSNNLAIVKSSEDSIEIKCLTRSLINSARDFAAESIAATFKLAGATTSLSGAYPGWKPDPNSAILQTMITGYQRLYDKAPEVKVIHAGLECGLLSEPYPNMDMISFGPTIRGAHSPDERCYIPSVQKFWDYLLDSIANIPVK